MCQHRGQDAEETFYVVAGKLTKLEHRKIKYGRKTGGWLTVAPININRTE